MYTVNIIENICTFVSIIIPDIYFDGGKMHTNKIKTKS